MGAEETDSRGARRSPSSAVFLGLATGGLYVPFWWYAVTREVEARSAGGAQGERGPLLLPIFSGLALALGLVGLWSFLWLAVVQGPDSLGALALLVFLVGAAGTAAAVSHTVARTRSLEETAGRPALSKRRIRALGLLLIPFTLTWPIVLVNFVYTIEQHLDALSNAPSTSRRGPDEDGRYGWAGWARWQGYRGLLARVARACVREAGGAAEGAACLIEVAALGDSERFRGPHEFQEDVTPEALRRFERIRIVAAGERVRVRVRFQRGRAQGGFRFGTGVEMAVHGGAETSSEQVGRARNAVAAAIDRGSGRFSTMVDDSTGEPRVGALETTCWESERFIRTLAVAAFVLSFHVGLFGLGPWIGGVEARVAILQVGAAVGAAASFAATPLLAPSVSVAETATTERVRRVGGQVGLVVLSGLFGAALRILLGG